MSNPLSSSDRHWLKVGLIVFFVVSFGYALFSAIAFLAIDRSNLRLAAIVSFTGLYFTVMTTVAAALTRAARQEREFEIGHTGESK